jgi:hypothetical protein
MNSDFSELLVVPSTGFICRMSVSKPQGLCGRLLRHMTGSLAVEVTGKFVKSWKLFPESFLPRCLLFVHETYEDLGTR